MKVAIVSMQRIINCGSFLQGYGLKSEIESLGHKAEFVDFRLKKKKKAKHAKSFKQILRNKAYRCLQMAGLRPPSHKHEVSQERVAFLQSFKKELWPELGLPRRLKFKTAADVAVFGSDEIFNIGQYLNDYHPPFSLYGSEIKCPKISYAASFGHTTEDDFANNEPVADEVKRLLSGFVNHSARDQNSFDLIKSMTGREPVRCIDPVLLHDFDSVLPPPPNEKPYVLIYAYSRRIKDPGEISAVKAFAEKEGLELITLNNFQSFSPDVKYVHPFVMLSYFKHARYVITDTFHGAVISIKYGRQFAAFVRDSNRQKLGGLLKEFGISAQEVTSPEKLDSVLKTEIDYEQVGTLLEQKRAAAKQYLRENLENAAKSVSKKPF